ncbi:MAG: hypothetical protein GY925_00390 [Actinomycetia bacterium]|nr:hypothetical protein [Actinomycetes bacterium]
MRDRRPSDWIADLTGRHELEQQVAGEFEANPAVRLLETNTNRYDRLDYSVATTSVTAAGVELKAKWQPYRGWGHHRPDVDQADLFILDELALRRIVTDGTNSHLLIYDHPMRRWVIFGVADLILAPKARIARQLQGRRPTTKGKVLIDLRDGLQAGQDLPTVITRLGAAINDTDRRWPQVEPWPAPQTGAAS